MRATNGLNSTYQYLGAEAKRLGDSEWESLGDMGWIDEDGYVYLADRRKDLILRGGANVYPAEVEAAIDLHPAVRSCAVVGLPDDDLGERVHAIVDAPGGVDQAELREHMASATRVVQVPRHLRIRRRTRARRRRQGSAFTARQRTQLTAHGAG